MVAAGQGFIDGGYPQDMIRLSSTDDITFPRCRSRRDHRSGPSVRQALSRCGGRILGVRSHLQFRTTLGTRGSLGCKKRKGGSRSSHCPISREHGPA